jgi:histone H3/H4
MVAPWIAASATVSAQGATLQIAPVTRITRAIGRCRWSS